MHLPIHYVDSSVILEFLLKQEKRDICGSYLNKAGYEYSIRISTIVLGEVIKTLNKLTDWNARIFVSLDKHFHQMKQNIKLTIIKPY